MGLSEKTCRSTHYGQSSSCSFVFSMFRWVMYFTLSYIYTMQQVRCKLLQLGGRIPRVTFACDLSVTNARYMSSLQRFQPNVPSKKPLHSVESKQSKPLDYFYHHVHRIYQPPLLQVDQNSTKHTNNESGSGSGPDKGGATFFVIQTALAIIGFKNKLEILCLDDWKGKTFRVIFGLSTVLFILCYVELFLVWILSMITVFDARYGIASWFQDD